MHIIRLSGGLLLVFALSACMAPQAAQPTIAPSATLLPASPGTEATQSASTAMVVPATSMTPPTATQPASASATAPGVPTMGVSERTLALQQPPLQGEDVRALQQRLFNLGYSQVGAVDGIFGPQTEVAVRAFQQTNRLQVDGIVGPQTRARLFGPAATAAVVPIVVHTSSAYLLGGVQRGTWLVASSAAPLLTGGERYRVLTDQNAETTAVGTKPLPLEVICTETYTVSLKPAIAGDAAVAVGGSWPLQPRPLVELAADDPMSHQAVTTFLRSKGIAQPNVQIVRAVTIDLDRDGSDEVVLSATHLTSQDPTDAIAGDYSFVAVQKTVNNQAIMVELAGNYFPQGGDFVAPNEHRVLGVLDLNGDGLIEVVINSTYYEGLSISAYQVEGNTARTLLTTGCGV